MVNVKGTSIKSTLNYLTKKFGADKLPKVLETLSQEDKAILSKSIVVTEWYPFKTWINLLIAIDKVLGKGDLELCRDSGVFGAEHDLNTVYKLFYKLSNPHFIASRASIVWKQYYNSGRMESIKINDKEMAIRIYDFEEPNIAQCKRIQGWAEKSMEMSGAKKLIVTHTKCRCKGDEYCEFVGKWE